MKRKSDNRRAFCVVQFIELPFEGIDDYVCVPNTWLIVRKATNDKAVVAYPKDEDPFDTRDRVERKERYSDEWRFYMAAVKYESNSYSDAEFWIATRNDYGPLVEKELKVTETQPKLPVNKKLRSANQNHLSKSNDNFRKPLPRTSIKRPRKSESRKEIDKKLMKLDESAQPSSAVVNNATVEPTSRSPKRKQSVIIQDNQSMERSQAEESSVASNADESTESRSKTLRTEQTEQALSSPVKDVDKYTEVMNIDNEDHSQRVKKPDQNNSMSQANSSTDVSMTAAKPSTAAEQSTQPNNHMNGARRLIPFRIVEKRLRPTKMERNLAITAQNPSNSIDQTRHLSTSSVEQSPVITQIQSQNDPRVLRTHTGHSKDLTALRMNIGMTSQEIHRTRINLKTSTDLAAVDPRNVLQSVNNAATTSQQLPSLSHKPPSYIRRSDVTQQRQMQSNQLDSHQQQQRPKLRIDISIKPKYRKQMPTLQGVTKNGTPRPILTKVLNSIRQTLSSTHNNFISNNPQLQAKMSPRSTGDNNVELTTSPQNIIASETSDRQNTEMPSLPIYQPSRIQHTTAHENRYQNLCTQEQLVDQSTRTNLKKKELHFMDDAARLPVTASHLNVMDCQTDECMVDETLSPYHAETSDSDAVTDHDEISDREMSTDESPVETTNNVYGTANDSADRPTAAQNSTARSHQMNPKLILMQQILDNSAALFTQMGSTLRHTTDMYNTLRSLVLDTAETYKKLLGAVEQFNTAGNAASNAFPSSNLRPESPRSPEERHTKVTASASSSNQDQHSNHVANKTPKKTHKKLYRFVLPPEYDAYDTRWTLKYRTNLPGLVELMPQSGVNVSYGDLKYCLQVSKDCKSLARRLLPEVFNRNALSVCSSMSETAQASNNVGSNIRPDLDDHACSVLLNFVLERGLQRGWNTDLEPILSTLHNQMQEIRFKYGVMVEC